MIILQSMIISVYIDEKDESKSVEIEENAKVSELLKKLNINPVTVIVTRGDNLLMSEENLKDNEELKILSVVSGG